MNCRSPHVILPVSVGSLRVRHLLLMAFAVGLSVAPALAETYDDKSLPLHVHTPDGFTIRAVEATGYDLVLHIDPVGDFPSRAARETRLCDLRFKAAPSRDSQQWFNGRWKDETVLSQVRGLVEGILEIRSEATFTLGDVIGMEFVGIVRQDPTAVTMMSLALTPRGQLQMSCAILAEQADKALPVLRSIRDTIRPPK